MTRLYLDCCCYNRPFDDQEQERVKEETAAVLEILRLVDEGRAELAAGGALLYELSHDPDEGRRRRTISRVESATIPVRWDPETERLAAEIERMGFGRMDAAHLASAISVECDAFLTVDLGILRRARRLNWSRRMVVDSPLTWLRDHGR